MTMSGLMLIAVVAGKLNITDLPAYVFLFARILHPSFTSVHYPPWPAHFGFVRLQFRWSLACTNEERVSVPFREWFYENDSANIRSKYGLSWVCKDPEPG